MNTKVIILLSAAALGLSACSSIKSEAKYPSGYDRAMTGGDIYGKKQSVLGSDGTGLFGGKSKKETDNGISVNGFLWRASLDTVSFMPLASADPFGGVILTDWYTPEENGTERYKLNVFIMNRDLRSDAIEVKVFRQERSAGTWKDVDTSEEMARKLEDTILTRARQLRIAELEK